MSGFVFIVIVAAMTIAVGLKGFTPQGLPITQEKKLTGTRAKIVGALCLAVGVGLLLLAPLSWILNAMASRTQKQIENQRAALVEHLGDERGPRNRPAVQVRAVNTASGKIQNDANQLEPATTASGKSTNK